MSKRTSPKNAGSAQWSLESVAVALTPPKGACCKACAQQLPTGEVRLGLFWAHAEGRCKVHWHHLQCAENIEQLREGAEVSGVGALKDPRVKDFVLHWLDSWGGRAAPEQPLQPATEGKPRGSKAATLAPGGQENANANATAKASKPRRRSKSEDGTCAGARRIPKRPLADLTNRAPANAS